MTRTLVLIAGASFVLAVACLSGAAALGWNGVHKHGWGHNWNIDFDDGHGVRWIRHVESGDAAAGPTATREIAWTGGSEFDNDISADVQFTQAPGPAKLVVTGPKALLMYPEILKLWLAFVFTLPWMLPFAAV